MPKLRFLPLWWVRQYTNACGLPLSATERLRITRRQAFEPGMTRDDWDLLGLLMGYLQHAILDRPRRPEQWISITDAAFLHACAPSLIAEESVIRFWSTLPSMRSKSKATRLPFTQCEEVGDGLRFRILRSDLPTLFGFDVIGSSHESDRELDLPQGFVLVDEALWQALPLDLRLAYLSMERKVQNQLVHGASTFYSSVADFFPQHLPLDKKSGVESEANTVIDQLRRLLLLGRLLTEKGWLHDLEGLKTEDFDDHGDDILVAWRIRDSRRTSYLHVYRQALECLVSSLEAEHIDALVLGWAPATKTSKREGWSEYWWRMIAGYDASCDSRMSFADDRLGASSALLFLEYAARVSSGEDLPYLVADRRVQALFASTTDLRRKFSQFVDLISESEEFLITLIRESRSGKAGEEKPATLDDETTADLSVRQLSSPGIKAEVLPLSADPAPPRDKERNDAKRLSTALQARMRKIATEELKKMDEAKFRSLKRTFLESLDEAGRRTMLDLQKRMQARMFEDHLRQHLVRFMVENPGSWTAKAAKS